MVPRRGVDATGVGPKHAISRQRAMNDDRIGFTSKSGSETVPGIRTFRRPCGLEDRAWCNSRWGPRALQHDPTVSLAIAASHRARKKKGHAGLGIDGGGQTRAEDF